MDFKGWEVKTYFHKVNTPGLEPYKTEGMYILNKIDRYNTIEGIEYINAVDRLQKINFYERGFSYYPEILRDLRSLYRLRTKIRYVDDVKISFKWEDNFLKFLEKTAKKRGHKINLIYD